MSKNNFENKGIGAFFPYFGAKYHIAEVISNAIPHKGINRYIEGFGGAGNVLLQKPYHQTEIYNELDYDIYNVFYCMADSKLSYKFIKRMEEIPFEEEVFNYSLKNVNKTTDRLDRAVFTLTILLQCFNGILGEDYKRAKWKGLYSEDLDNWYDKKLLNLYDVQERLQGVKTLNMDALELVKQYREDEETTIYLDSPYENSTRAKGAQGAYKKDNANGFNHVEYLSTIIDVKKCKLIASGYDCKLYNDILVKEGGWNTYIVDTVKKNCQIIQLGDIKTEVDEIIWTNFKI